MRRLRLSKPFYNFFRLTFSFALTEPFFPSSQKEQTYEAQRNPMTNPLDYTFDLCTYSVTLAPAQSFTLDICYRPFQSFAKSVDYFTITDLSGVHTELSIRGNSIGPDVTLSMNKLVLFSPEENCEVKKRIKLTNRSKMTATFMFDLDNARLPFKIDSTHGYIERNSHRYVTVSFLPLESGKYVYYLACLILHQGPIIVELRGYCGLMYRKEVDYHRFVQTESDRKGFEGYMRDTSPVTQGDPPPISLSNHYFDFGRVDVDAEDSIRRTPQSTCFTNHTSKRVSIKWDKDPLDIFGMKPAATRVGANQSALFEIYFNPNAKDEVFVKEYIGWVCVDEEDTENMIKEESASFLWVASLRIIGHSFSIGSTDWMAQYEIPQTVVMPACVPPYPVYTTFVIKKFGHFPLMFRFVPPPASHFVVKPMLGIIYEDHQIVVLELIPKVEGEHAYVERWAIRFNGNPKQEAYIDFRGYAEYANIHFRDNAHLTFPPVHVGCQQVQQLNMRNITRHTIQFKFANTHSELQMERSRGEIHPNEILSHEWVFCPTTVGEFSFDVEYSLTIVKSGSLAESEHPLFVRVTGISEYGYLVAVPDILNFDTVAYGETEERRFRLFNYSSVSIHYKMVCIYRSWQFESISDVTINPCTETIYPGTNETITVSITPRIPEYYELVVQYFVRMNSQTDNLILEQSATSICKVNCMCILPRLQIIGLEYYGSCPEMSKELLWETMKINKFNKILRDILPGHSKTLPMYPCPMLSCQIPLVLKFLITNPMAVNVSWTLRRVQLCSCQCTVKSRGLSFRYTEYDCIHKNIWTIYPKWGTLKPNEDIILTMKIRYNLLGKTNMRWVLDIGNERRIFLDMTIECVSGTAKQLHLLYGPCAKFECIYFGNKDPVSQMCWIHNYSNSTVPYMVDVDALHEINENYHGSLFLCLKPYGTVKPHCSHPIVLLFQPRQFGAHQVKLPLTLGDNRMELLLEGESCYAIEKTRLDIVLPTKLSNNKLEDIPIYFNTDCIDISHVPMHTTLTRMLMVYNNLYCDNVSFEWTRCEVPGVLSVKVDPAKGIIQSKGVKTFCVTVTTGGYSSKVRVTVPCAFLNISQRRDYQRSVFKHITLCRELEGQFSITEKGVIIPRFHVKILDMPEPFYQSLTISCYIHSPEDEDLNISLIDQLKTTPSHDYIKRTSAYRDNKLDLNMQELIIENMIWDIVSSKIFHKTVQGVLAKHNDLYYSQFQMNATARKRLVRRSYIRPPPALLNAILENMLFIMIHEEFALDVTHLIQQQDIRHSNYMREISDVHKRRIHKYDDRTSSLY